MIAVLTFEPNGTGHCLYTEAIDLQTIGSLQVERATTIEFVGNEQHWEVRDGDGTVLFHHPSRTVCLAWEHHHFNR